MSKSLFHHPCKYKKIFTLVEQLLNKTDMLLEYSKFLQKFQLHASTREHIVVDATET